LKQPLEGGEVNKLRSFKIHEIYSTMRLPPTTPFIVRCDGRNFRSLCSRLGFKKPFDEDFAKIMVAAAKAVFNSGFNPTLAYIQSDEISYLFTKEQIFNRRLEKILSIIPSLISSRFTLELSKIKGVEEVAAFDARIVALAESDIVDYFAWRQMEAWRNHINAYALHALIKRGMTTSQAAKKLYKMKSPELHDLVMKELNVNLAKTPAWQRRGIVLRWRVVEKQGINPVTGEASLTIRRCLTEDWDPPLFTSPEGRKYLEEAILAAEKEISNTRD